MKKFLDTDHPALKPLWVRVLIVAFAGGWGIFEFATGAPFWGVIFLGMAGYAAWAFFLAGDRDGA
jgi:hypothetical protein